MLEGRDAGSEGVQAGAGSGLGELHGNGNGRVEARCARRDPRFRGLDTNSDMSAPEPVAAGRPDEGSTSENQNEERVEETVSPTAPITESEVGEYREQDRVLPVSRSLGGLSSEF